MKQIAILGCENSHAEAFLGYLAKHADTYADVRVIGVYSDERDAAEKLRDKFGVAVMEHYADAVGNPYPPFAFGSGLDWFELSAAEAAALGLDPAAAKSAAAKSLSPDPEELRRAVEETGLDLDALMEEYG